MGKSAEMKQDTKQDLKQTENTKQDMKQAVDVKQDIKQEDIISLVAGKIDLSQAEIDILRILVDAPKTNMRTIAERLGLNITKVFRLMDKLRSKKIIERVGSSQKGYWKVTIDEKANG